MNKIDSNKLLSPSKNSAIQKKIDSSVLVPYKNIKISTKKINLGKKTGEEKGDDELIKTISSIKESLLQIESLLKNNSNILARKLKRDKKDKENERRKEKETNLETKKSDKDKFPNLKKPNLPRTGIFDYIKNFLTWVIIGRAFVLFSKYLPKLLEFVKYLTPLYDFVKTITGALFNGLVTFVEWTDKAQKKLREVVGSLGGEPFQKAFDDFGGALTTFMNLALIAGMATMGGSDLGVGDALDDIDPDGKKPKGSRRRPGVTTSGGRRAGRPGLRNPLRKRPKITGTPGLRNPLRQRPKVTGTPGLNNPLKQRPKITGATNAPANVPKLPPSAGSAGKLGAKALLKTVRPILRGMIIGGLIDFGLSVALGEDPGRAAFGAIGATLLGTIGGILGGPFAPFTAIGGGILGDWAGRKLYDAFFSGQKTTPQSKPQIAGGGMGGRRGGRGMQGGGSVQPKTGTPVRPRRSQPSNNYIKQPIILPPKKVVPGKDIGGEQKIKRIFPDTDPNSVTVEDWMSATDASGQPYAGKYEDFIKERRKLYKNKPNPFKALTKTSEILKKIPVVGTLMGAGVDAALGQSFDSKIAIGQFTNAMGYIADSIANQQISNLENAVKTFSDGGSISSAESIAENSNQISSAKLIEKLLGPLIEKRINRVLANVKAESDKESTRPEDRADPSEGPGSLDDTYDYEVTGGEKPSKYPGRYLDHGYKGRDYQIEVGRAITVFSPGVVTYAQYNNGGFGRLVIVKHENGQESYYAHLSKINVNVGDTIGQNGTVIGLTGGDPNDPGSGRTTGPHLHFELRDSKGNRITEENSGDNFFRFGIVKSARRRVGTLKPGEAGKPGQQFTIAQLVTLAKKAGFKGNNAAVAAAVAMAESSGDSKAHFTPEESGGTDDSYGLWQINMIGGMGPERRKQYRLKSNQDLWDPATNANIAFKMSGGSNFNAWSTYNPRNSTTPKYLEFLPDAQKALQKGDVTLPGAPKVPDLRPSSIPSMPDISGQEIDKNYGMKTGDEFIFKLPDGKQYKARKTAKGFDFYTLGLFGLGSQKIDTTKGQNQQIVDAFIREKQKQANTPSKTSGRTKVSIYSGHADMSKKSPGGIGTMGGIEKLLNSNFLSNEAFLNDLIAKNVAAKSGGTAVYRPPVKTDSARDPNSNWERARRDVSAGIVPFEMHHDQPGGSAGLLMGSNYNSRLKDPFIKSLHNLYGRHGADADKGFFKYGGAIVEVSSLTPSILKDQKNISSHVESQSSRIANALSTTKMQGGGNIDMNYKKIQRTDGLNTYEDEENTVVYIQPVYFIPDQNQNYIASGPPPNYSSARFIRSSSYIP
jgi:murein DD-endopeptidase MepM/ murein hydrolase activator NlpD